MTKLYRKDAPTIEILPLLKKGHSIVTGAGSSEIEMLDHIAKSKVIIRRNGSLKVEFGMKPCEIVFNADVARQFGQKCSEIPVVECFKAWCVWRVV